MNWFRASLLVLILPISPTLGRAEDLSADELVKRYEETFNALGRCELQFEERWKVRGNVDPSANLDGKQNWTCRHIKTNWYFHEKVFSIQGKTIKELPEVSERIFRDGKFMQVQADSSNNELIVYGFRNLPKNVSAGTLGVEGDFMLVFGYLQGNGNALWLPDLLRQSRLSVSTTKLDGREVKRLDASSQNGVNTIWLDPAVGYLPRRLESRKSGNDLTNEKPVQSIQGLQVVTTVVDQFEIERQGDLHLIRSFVSKCSLKYSNREETIECFTKITGMNLNPTFTANSFTPSIPIPDGTTVQMNDAPTIKFEWRGGQIIKAVDGTVVMRLGDVSFLAGNMVRTMIQFLLCVVVLGTLGWWLVRRSRARA